MGQCASKVEPDPAKAKAKADAAKGDKSAGDPGKPGKEKSKVRRGPFHLFTLFSAFPAAHRWRARLPLPVSPFPHWPLRAEGKRGCCKGAVPARP